MPYPRCCPLIILANPRNPTSRRISGRTSRPNIFHPIARSAGKSSFLCGRPLPKGAAVNDLRGSQKNFMQENFGLVCRSLEPQKSLAISETRQSNAALRFKDGRKRKNALKKTRNSLKSTKARKSKKARKRRSGQFRRFRLLVVVLVLAPSWLRYSAEMDPFRIRGL